MTRDFLFTLCLITGRIEPWPHSIFACPLTILFQLIFPEDPFCSRRLLSISALSTISHHGSPPTQDLQFTFRNLRDVLAQYLTRCVLLRVRANSQDRKNGTCLQLRFCPCVISIIVVICCDFVTRCVSSSF